MKQEKMITTKQAAKVLGLKESSIGIYATTGLIKTNGKRGKAKRFTEASVLNYKNNRKPQGRKGINQKLAANTQSSKIKKGVPSPKPRKKIAQKKALKILNASSNVNHPLHYNTGKIEVIDAIEDWKLGFHDGNVIKYIVRANSKGNRERDLQKALWYIQRLLDNLNQ
tara:strand:- start:3082 stop:3585 length:504 start_codon:yes stop_codon:yes gene_type:complete